MDRAIAAGLPIAFAAMAILTIALVMACIDWARAEAENRRLRERLARYDRRRGEGGRFTKAEGSCPGGTKDRP